jgi:tetratricopeptide (TPR) repeat protein
MTPEQADIVHAAQLAHAAGRVEEALNGFLRAAEMNPPGEVLFYDLIGHCFAALSRGVEAIRYYKAFVEKDQSSAAVWSNLAAFCFNNGEFATAAHAMSEAIRINGPTRDTMLLRFLALYYAQSDDQIEPLFDEYLRLYADEYPNIEKLLEYVNSHQSLERRDQVMELLLKVGSQHLAIVMTVFIFFQNRSRLDRAAEMMDAYLTSKVRILQNEVMEGYFHFAEFLLATNQIARATARLTRGLQRLRSITYSARLLLLMGCARSRSGEPGVAGEFYRTASESTNVKQFRLLRTTFSCA